MSTRFLFTCIWLISVLLLKINESATTTIAPFDEIIDVNYTVPYNYWATNESVSCSPGSNCIVNCIGKKACYYLNIHANHSRNLYLNCIGSSSCRKVDVFAPSTAGNELIINCNNTSPYNDSYSSSNGACEYIDIYANNINNISITCVNEHDCYYANLYANNAQNLDIVFNDKYSGWGVEIFGQNVSNSFHVLCNGQFSCYRAEIYCPLSVYNTTCDIDCVRDGSCSNMEFNIESSSYRNLDISCNLINKTHCFDAPVLIGDNYAIIKCTDNDYESELIYDKFDNKLSCHAGCCPFEILEIECDHDSELLAKHCIIDCTEQFCEGHLINGTDKALLSVNCKQNNMNSTCNGLTIYCPINGICNIVCDSPYGCSDMVIISDYNTKQNDIIIECSAIFSCHRLMLNASNSNSIRINSTASYSMYVATIHGENVADFDMFCKNLNNTHHYHETCLYGVLYLPSDEDSNVNIDCFGTSCYGLDFYVTNGMESISKNISITSYCQCGDGAYKDCIGLWFISCGSNYEYETYYYGYTEDEYCWSKTSDLIDCGCSSMINNLRQSYIDNDDEQCDINRTNTTPTIIVSTSEPTMYNEATLYNASYTTNTLNKTAEESKTKLKSGAITGIAMSVLFVIGLMLLCCFMYESKRKKDQQIQIINANPEHPQRTMLQMTEDEEPIKNDADGQGTKSTNE